MAKFGMRNEYRIVPVRNMTQQRTFVVIGYAAICTCALGNHYLAPDGEHTAQEGVMPYSYPTYADAQAAIEAWQRQHQHESEE